MSYISENIIPNENLVYLAKIHWIIYLPAFLLMLLGVVFIVASSDDTYITGAVIIFVALIFFARALIYKMTTELGVTDKRVIAKIGLIRRDTIELNHSKVESYNINQSILGRILDYGTLIINGTGGGKTPIKNIDSPLEFRKKAIQEADAEQG